MKCRWTSGELLRLRRFACGGLGVDGSWVGRVRLGGGGRSRARPRANHPLRPSCPRRRLLGEDGLHGGQTHPRLAGTPVPVHPRAQPHPPRPAASPTPGWRESPEQPARPVGGPDSSPVSTSSGGYIRRSSPPGDSCASGGVGPGGRRRRASRDRAAPQDQTRGSGTVVGATRTPQRARGTPGHAPHHPTTGPRAPQAHPCAEGGKTYSHFVA